MKNGMRKHLLKILSSYFPRARNQLITSNVPTLIMLRGPATLLRHWVVHGRSIIRRGDTMSLLHRVTPILETPLCQGHKVIMKGSDNNIITGHL